ncbi:hypothetical protein [Algoriphagus aquimarinus]|uniref:DUF4268 domain-containing protein n=1 Tax=Algoriphagus aquimarinus TaxID=237018 RepID=A0A1I0ZI13_9BACT|nr:hypothetical protein [Algoriphagus aquimarinus]SFB25151.1 hypothetical protein SAMN04489723_10698 [Algoriphagus aquimarinus]
MAEESNYLDLDLWLDQDIIPRQNRLKAKFWEILAEVGNSFEPEKLQDIHSRSRGVKLSKGNDLLGYPYQVLDIIRDFDLTNGLNIRILNWFGHGLFLFVQIGKNNPKAPFQELSENKWVFDQSSSPWDYPEILLNNAFTNSPTVSDFEKSTFYQWHKCIQISGEKTTIEDEIMDELKKLIFLLS